MLAAVPVPLVEHREFSSRRVPLSDGLLQGRSKARVLVLDLLDLHVAAGRTRWGRSRGIFQSLNSLEKLTRQHLLLLPELEVSLPIRGSLVGQDVDWLPLSVIVEINGQHRTVIILPSVTEKVLLGSLSIDNRGWGDPRRGDGQPWVREPITAESQGLSLLITRFSRIEIRAAPHALMANTIRGLSLLNTRYSRIKIRAAPHALMANIFQGLSFQFTSISRVRKVSVAAAVLHALMAGQFRRLTIVIKQDTISTKFTRISRIQILQLLAYTI